MGLIEVEQFHVNLFPLPDDEQIDKIRQRFGIIGAGAARNHQGKPVPLGSQLGKPRQLQHGENRRITHLIGEIEPNDIKFCRGRIGFQRIERNPRLLHAVLHVLKGRIGALGIGILPLVGQMVENGCPQMGHAHFINVRKSE